MSLSLYRHLSVTTISSHKSLVNYTLIRNFFLTARGCESSFFLSGFPLGACLFLCVSSLFFLTYIFFPSLYLRLPLVFHECICLTERTNRCWLPYCETHTQKEQLIYIYGKSALTMAALEDIYSTWDPSHILFSCSCSTEFNFKLDSHSPKWESLIILRNKTSDYFHFKYLKSLCFFSLMCSYFLLALKKNWLNSCLSSFCFIRKCNYK